jgi:hypothetical protein
MAQQSPEIPILKVAWTRYAQMDAASSAKTRGHTTMRKWIAWLGILATLFAVLTQIYPENWSPWGSVALKFFLIATPVAGAVVSNIVSRRYASGDWLALRAGAEGIQREVYTYRTILQKSSDRRAWLEKRLADVQRQVYRSLGGKLILKPYKGPIPPYYYPDDNDSDPGFHDLTGDEYYRFRLRSQLAWHIKKVNQIEAEERRLSNWILVAGGAGTVLAGIGSSDIPGAGGLTLWVAVTAAIASALMGWEELRNLDATIKNYSKVILELNLLAEHWENLEPEERSETEFFQMVRYTEEILWSQNIEYIKSMQEALASVQDKEPDLIDQVLRDAKAADEKAKAGIREQIVGNVQKELDAGVQGVQDAYREAQETIVREATSERAQQELSYIVAASGVMASAMQDKIKSIADEFAGIVFGKDTPKEVLHAKMSKYPSTGEIKG